jgi:hypothetical protein
LNLRVRITGHLFEQLSRIGAKEQRDYDYQKCSQTAANRDLSHATSIFDVRALPFTTPTHNRPP